MSRVPKICLFCGKNFKTYECVLSKGRGSYCSLSCKYSGMVDRKLSPETRQKISEGNKNKVLSKETRDKISLSRTGKKYPLASIAKRKENLSIETRKKRSEAKLGEKSHFWKGGITKINLTIRNSLEYRLWRESVFKRDNYTCQICGVHSGNGKMVKLNADHIKSFAYYPELRFSLDNGRTLCEPCHKKTDTFGSKNNYKRIVDKVGLNKN